MDQIQRRSAWTLAVRDLRDGLTSIHVWPMLGWSEIRQRYRRSALGPFWLTISTGILVAGMGPLYGRLFGQEVGTYFPFLAIGFIVWQLIASLMNDSGQVFIAAEQYIKQVRMPFTIHVLRMIWRNAIIFAHNFVIVILVLVAFVPAWNWQLLMVLPGLVLLLINGIWLAMMLGMLCARFRDIPQIITSIVQVAFFLTPVMWRKEMLGHYQWAADVNPLYHLIEIVRAPLLGQSPANLSWMVVAMLTLGGFAVTMPLFARYRARIAYWI
ncbi:MAG TPA: ABC transporter permease [Burkholderiales bacterium]|nr:ABC transporter permease [Burkholderiales bacterium]